MISRPNNYFSKTGSAAAPPAPLVQPALQIPNCNLSWPRGLELKLALWKKKSNFSKFNVKMSKFYKLFLCAINNCYSLQTHTVAVISCYFLKYHQSVLLFASLFQIRGHSKTKLKRWGSWVGMSTLCRFYFW